MNMPTFTMKSILLVTILLPIFADFTDKPASNPVQLETHSIIRPDIEISVIIMACVVCCIVTIGIIGNVLVICVLTCNRTRMVYETFCVGLAVTDLIYLTMTSPITVMQYFLNSWIFGIFWCKVFNFIVQVTVFSSAFMLLGLTTSRFLAVVLPWQNLKTTEFQAKLVCIGAWLVGIIFALPIIIFQVLIPAPFDDILPSNITILNTVTDFFDNTSHFSTETPKFPSGTIIQLRSLINNMINSNEVHNQEVFCREQFPSQSSRMSYQLFVLLSTYVLPFACILILNSCIVLRLRQKNIAEKEVNQFRRFSTHESSIYIRSNNAHNDSSNCNNTDNPNNKETITSNYKWKWLRSRRKRLESIHQENLELNRFDLNRDSSRHQHHQQNNGQKEQQHLERRISSNTITSNPTSPGSGNDTTTTSNCLQRYNSQGNILHNPNELVRVTRELKKKRLRSKATKLVVLVTTLWGVCWLPTHIINSWFFFDEASFPFVPAMKIAKLLSQTLSFAASCVNPVVYSILTGSFKTALSKRLLRFKKRSQHERNRTELLYVTE
ncbi:unnamed protein product [Heterobilharzia americana]|nr:unnamed protein product [Heterobilharzia americana]